jgi:hypothetical protein
VSRPKEATQIHTRLLKCALEVEDSRAYWKHADGRRRVTPQEAFDEYWFGARSLPRIKILLVNLRGRYDAFPPSLAVLHRWDAMGPDTRRLVCHWHLQLADPLYRAFTGAYLIARHAGARAEVTRDLVVRWVGEQGPERWTMSTRIQFASKLLSAAYAAGLVGTNRDPRPVTFPRVTDEALEYLAYLLREVDFEGTLLSNPYVASVGLTGGLLEERLRALPGLELRRQGELLDLGWRHDGLAEWGAANLGPRTHATGGVTP